MVRRLAGLYLIAQGLAVPSWWILLSVSPAFRSLFEMGEPSVLDSFLLPDALLAAGSILAGAAALRNSRSRTVLAGVTLGLMAYSTLSTAAWVHASRAGTLGLVTMGLATLGTVLALLAVWRRS